MALPAEPPHPTAEQVDALVELAKSASTLEAFGHDMRRLLGLPGEVRITKKFLKERLTMAQYEDAWQAYRRALKAKIEEDVSDFAPPQGHGAPTELPSAPDEAREKLRAEALGWGIQPSEVEHVLHHHRDIQKARTLLWRARRAPAATGKQTALVPAAAV